MFPWQAGAGGVITLDEPLSIEELQTGALVLLMTRDGQPCEAVGVVDLRRVGVIDSIQFYAFGRPVAEVVTGASVTDITNGVFQLRISDNSSQWQIVGARIDRQFWHGQVITDLFYAVNSAGQVPEAGEDGLAAVEFSSGGRFSVSVHGIAPLGGRYADTGRVAGLIIYGGGQTLADYADIEVNTPSFTPAVEYMAVKAIFVVNADYNVMLRVLYPTDFASAYLDVPVFNEAGQGLHFDDGQSEWYLGEI